MRHLFLTSSVHAVAHDIAKRVDLSRSNKLVFIDTAAEIEKGDKNWLKKDRKALVDAGFKVSDYTITGKSKNQLETDLTKFDYIYLSGGNTSYLLMQSQKTGFKKLIRELVEKKGKIYIGTSAGSIIAGPRLPDYYADEHVGVELTDKDCYGFVNFTLVPHWGDKDFRERYLGKRLKQVYNEDQVPLLLLTNHHYVHVQGDKMEIVEVND